MIIRKIDGSEYCDLCKQTIDKTCKECVSYQNPMFTYDEKTHTTWFHGYNEWRNENGRSNKSDV